MIENKFRYDTGHYIFALASFVAHTHTQLWRTRPPNNFPVDFDIHFSVLRTDRYYGRFKLIQKKRKNCNPNADETLMMHTNVVISNACALHIGNGQIENLKIRFSRFIMEDEKKKKKTIQIRWRHSEP